LKDDFAIILDYIFFILNFLAVLFLFYFIFENYELYGYLPTSISFGVSANGGLTTWSIDLWPLIAIATIFLISQIYLNYRLLRKDSHETNNRTQGDAE